MKKIILVALFFLCSSFAVYCADIKFTWDQNPEADLKGYKIHRGASSRVYTDVVDVGNTIEYRWMSLPDGEWYFAATAYDVAGNESEYSNEVTFVIDTSAPGSPTSFEATISAERVILHAID